MESESGREAERKTGNCGCSQRVVERPREGQGTVGGVREWQRGRGKDRELWVD